MSNAYIFQTVRKGEFLVDSGQESTVGSAKPSTVVVAAEPGFIRERRAGQ
jgi:hypothetical protein